MNDLGSSSATSAYTDVKIHICDRQGAGYPVELTLDGEREFPRVYLAPDVLRLLSPDTRESEAGERLFDLLFADPGLREAWAEARGKSPRRRVRLRIDPGELRPLPWELLPSAPGKPPLSLAADQNTPFSRYLPSPVRQGRPISERPLRALAAIASPEDLADYHLPALDLAVEERALAAIAAGIAEERLAATFLKPPITRTAILKELQKGYHILHLIAHGGSQRSTGEPGIFLADERNRATLVTQRELAETVEALGDSLRLVFLASCHSAASGCEAFQGLAPALVAAGIPAVVAMRERVPAETARQFALSFYQRLEAHGTVDLAANEARGALLTRGLPGAACPVLYMRLKDGALFVPTPRPRRSATALGTASEPAATAVAEPRRDSRPAARTPPQLPGVLLNGVDGATGEYFHPAFSSQEVVRLALRAAADAGRATAPEPWRHQRTRDHLGEEIEPTDLASAGWGVIFAQDADPEIRESLQPLLLHRQEQAGSRVERRFRDFSGEAGLRRGESKIDFLQRHGIGPGPPDPDKLPYYLLLVGSPEEIPYEFQSHLDVQYAVGRLCLGSPAAYRRYAEAVVAAEAAGQDQPRRATLFGMESPDDRMTFLMSEYLVRPVAEKLQRDFGGGKGGQPAWDIETLRGEEARKARLAAILSGSQAPALLFTACHGVAFPNGDRRQLAHQGALLCGDWPGPAAWRARGQRELPEEHYFCGDDVPSDARLAGLIAFHFACYGAGTPHRDSYGPANGGGARLLAPRDFVARLPQRLLEQGALAVVGHVDRAWGYSFIWKGSDDTRVFEQAFQRLLDGHPVGSALEAFHLKFAEISADLMAEKVRVDTGKTPDEPLLASLWTAAQDARNYVILGDPATRLPAAAGAPVTRRDAGAALLPAGGSAIVGAAPPSLPAPAAGSHAVKITSRLRRSRVLWAAVAALAATGLLWSFRGWNGKGPGPEPPRPTASPQAVSTPAVKPAPPAGKQRSAPSSGGPAEPEQTVLPGAAKVDMPPGKTSPPREAREQPRDEDQSSASAAARAGPSKDEKVLSTETSEAPRPAGEPSKAAPESPPANPRFLVLIDGEAESGTDLAETAFLDEILKGGYRAVDAAAIRSNEKERAEVTGAEPLRIAAIGRQYGADIVVVGRLESESERTVGKFYTGRGMLHIRTYQVSTGQILGAVTVQVGAGGKPGKLEPSALTARRKAAEACGREAAAAALEQVRAQR